MAFEPGYQVSLFIGPHLCLEVEEGSCHPRQWHVKDGQGHSMPVSLLCPQTPSHSS